MRINIEDKLFTDYRFKGLVSRLGEREAIGLCYQFWRAFADHWVEERLMPIEQFEVQNFGVLLEVGLAERHDGGIYAKGAGDRMEWIREKMSKGRAGGLASAAARKAKFGTSQPISKKTHSEQTPNNPNDCSAFVRRTPNPPAPAPTPTPKKQERVKTADAVVDAPPKFSAEDLGSLWNEHCGTLPKVIKVSEDRKRKATSRLRTQPDPAVWKDAISRVAASGFCNGESGRGWLATFDWLLLPASLIKILEGQYDNRERKAPRLEVVRSAFPLAGTED